jgi:hypothetical protein
MCVKTNMGPLISWSRTYRILGQRVNHERDSPKGTVLWFRLINSTGRLGVECTWGIWGGIVGIEHWLGPRQVSDASFVAHLGQPPPVFA